MKQSRKNAARLAKFAMAGVLAGMGVHAAWAADTQLNVYNWSDYIGKETIPDFEKQTGIHVRYDTFDSDDTLQAKLLAGSSGYDVVVPSSPYMAKQIEAGVYLKLDKSKLPNLANLNPKLMKMVNHADPGNRYGVPWAWGTDGIGYNVQKVRRALGDSAPVDSWSLVFDPAYLSKLRGCGVSFLDSAGDVFPAVLQYMHRDPNSTNPADYEAAFEVLKKVRPYVTQFSSSTYINDLASDDICVAFGWSGDVGIARRRAMDAHKAYSIAYTNPIEGGLLWFDMMAIPADAPHPEAALAWINYIEDPKTSAEITNEVFYPTANVASLQYVKPEVAKDPVTFPPEAVLDRLVVMQPLPADVVRLMNRLWNEYKSGI